jgi:two-component system cell cycle response regulator CtrA
MKVLYIDQNCSASFLIKDILLTNRIYCEVLSLSPEMKLTELPRCGLIIIDFYTITPECYPVLEQICHDSSTPILVLCPQNHFQEKIKIDSEKICFICKAFSQEDLINQIHFLASPAPVAQQSVKVGLLTLHAHYRIVEAYDKLLPLTSHEFKIVEALMQNRGSVVEKTALLKKLYQNQDCPDEKIIDVFVCKIRKKLEKLLGPAGKNYIITVWGRGYLMQDSGLKHKVDADLSSTCSDDDQETVFFSKN